MILTKFKCIIRAKLKAVSIKLQLHTQLHQWPS